MVAHMMGFWPFVSPGMLFWAGAAAAPIIIHLWNRRQHREMAWAAMQYLLAALQRKARRIRLQQWILLAVRTLILLLFALALADPVLRGLSDPGQPAAAGGNTHYVLVLDGSYSMDYRDGEQSRYDVARTLATRMVRESVQGDGFTLIQLADPCQVVIAEPAFDPQDVADEIAALRLRHTGADLAAALREVETVVQNAGNRHPRLTSTRVCFFSDLDLNAWQVVEEKDIQRSLQQLSQQARLVMLDVGQAETQNLAITSLASNQSLATLQGLLEFRVDVDNFGSREATDQQVELHVDGQFITALSLDVPAHGSATLVFNHVFQSAGDHIVEARLPSDSLPIDDHRWISVPVRESIGVLCVEGRPGVATNLSLALEPRQTRRPRVSVEVRPESALLERDLGSLDAVFLCNVARLNSEEANVLRDFVAGGGGLVIFLGDQVELASYNRLLESSDGRPALLPARLLELSTTALVALDPLGYRHPIVAPFRGNERAGLLTTPVWKYVRLELPEHDDSQIAVAFSTGDPAIVQRQVGQGICLLVSTAASDLSMDRTLTPPMPWNAWSSWPSYPPVVQELLSTALQGRTDIRNAQVGQPLYGVVSATAAGSSLAVTDPNDHLRRVPISLQGENAEWTFDPTYWSGIYRAAYGPPLSEIQWFATNVDTQESRLERLDAEQLPRSFDADLQVASDAAAELPTAPRGVAFRYLLAAVLGLLLLETWMAFAFGGGREG